MSPLPPPPSAALIVFTLTAALHAQTDNLALDEHSSPQELPAIIVTATRSAKSITDIAATVQRIERAQIAR